MEFQLELFFLGNINEEESLIQCLNAIHESSKKLSQNNFEVIISGPSSYDLESNKFI